MHSKRIGTSCVLVVLALLAAAGWVADEEPKPAAPAKTPLAVTYYFLPG